MGFFSTTPLMEYKGAQKAVKEYIEQNYAAADNDQDAEFTSTSKELFKKVNNSFPDFFTEKEVIEMLIDLGFKFADDQLEFRWLLKSKN